MTTEYKAGRRNFLKGVALGGITATATATMAQEPIQGPPSGTPSPSPNTPRSPGPVTDLNERTPRDRQLTYATCGGDYMVDVMRSLGIEYMASTPSNTMLGLHEAIVNYGMVSDPKLTFITTVHEEASVAMAHGYAKIEGKPMAVGMHATVGLQHGSMAIYNAWCDRVPIFMLVGANLDSARYRNATAWNHAAQDDALIVRDYTKWDDKPSNLRAWGEAAARAYKFGMTPPYGPTLLATDLYMQEDPYPGGKPPPIPKLPRVAPPVGESSAVEDTAKMLVAAERPVIFADRVARTPDGLNRLIELAELLQAPVCDSHNRFNFPWRHPLNQSMRRAGVVQDADFMLELEPGDPFSATSQRLGAGEFRSIMKPGSRRVTISSVDLFYKSNYQNFQRYPSDIDIAMAADAQATLPSLIEAVRRQLPANRKDALEARGARWARAHQADLEASKQAAAYAWDGKPISTARLYAELYEQMRTEDWSLLNATDFQSKWPQRLWTANKHYNYIGDSGAQGIGYLGPATLGGALANRKHGRLSVAVNGDGDTMFGPGILWTAAHERIPLLYIIHNNRGYHTELMQMQAMANRRNRGVDRTHIGNELADPNIDFAMVAKGMGVYAQGPIEHPADLGPAIRRAIAVVKKGEPALIDVISQGR